MRQRKKPRMGSPSDRQEHINNRAYVYIGVKLTIDVERAVRKYQAGVDAIGGSQAYYNCGDAGGWADVAECLHQLKRGMTSGDWAGKYRGGA